MMELAGTLIGMFNTDREPAQVRFSLAYYVGVDSGTWSLVAANASDFATGFTNSSSYPRWTSLHSNGLGPAYP
jgi:hypothetical protein